MIQIDFFFSLRYTINETRFLVLGSAYRVPDPDLCVMMRALLRRSEVCIRSMCTKLYIFGDDRYEAGITFINKQSKTPTSTMCQLA